MGDKKQGGGSEKNFGKKTSEQSKMIGATVERNNKKTEPRMLISQHPCREGGDG